MLEYSDLTFKRVGRAGTANIVVGILLIVGGLTLGILTIVHGGKLLASTKDLID